jgi:hypothetical protein
MSNNVMTIKASFETISKKLTDQTWSDAQDADFIEALRNTQEVITQLSTTIYVMSDYMEQYTKAVRDLPLFALSEDALDDSQLASPTQTDAARDPRVTGNRATRRAKRK